MMEEENFVCFESIQKSYDGENLVVKDLNLNIRKGEFLTMLGPSGSGKTTCLMMLSGFETATSGEIRLKGKPINNVPPHKRGIGMVFQNYALFPHMTVEENLTFPLIVRSMSQSDIKRRVDRVLDLVELQGYEKRMPSQLSGGQQQRVAVARALVFEPELILMDEPLGALDKQLREQMQYEIKRIHMNLQVTIVYVTHDQSEALTMSDRVAVFNEGLIQQISDPVSIYERPENSFVAQFIGENNQLQGTISKIRDKYCEVVLASGKMIKALPINVSKENEKTSISLRPEKIIINPKTKNNMNIVDGCMKELIFGGDQLCMHFEVEGNTNFIVKQANNASCAQIKKGEKVQLGFIVDETRALDYTGDSI